MDFLELGNPVTMKITLFMKAGIYQGGKFSFQLDIPPSYPFSAPSVRCLTRVWHPNICPYSGDVGLPIVTRDWRPVLSLNTVVFGLQLLFLEPNMDEIVNADAASALQRGVHLLGEQVQQTFRGGVVNGMSWTQQEGGAQDAAGDAASPSSSPSPGAEGRPRDDAAAAARRKKRGRDAGQQASGNSLMHADAAAGFPKAAPPAAAGFPGGAKAKLPPAGARPLLGKRKTFPACEDDDDVVPPLHSMHISARPKRFRPALR